MDYLKTPFWANNHSEMYIRVLQDELKFPDDRVMDQDTKSLIRGVSPLFLQLTTSTFADCRIAFTTKSCLADKATSHQASSLFLYDVRFLVKLFVIVS